MRLVGFSYDTLLSPYSITIYLSLIGNTSEIITALRKGGDCVNSFSNSDAVEVAMLLEGNS